MQEFKTDSRVLGNGTNTSIVLGNKQNEHRTHTLPSPTPYVLQHLGEKSVGVRQGIIEQLNKVVQIALNWLFYE